MYMYMYIYIHVYIYIYMNISSSSSSSSSAFLNSKIHHDHGDDPHVSLLFSWNTEPREPRFCVFALMKDLSQLSKIAWVGMVGTWQRFRAVSGPCEVGFHQRSVGCSSNFWVGTSLIDDGFLPRLFFFAQSGELVTSLLGTQVKILTFG